MKLASGQVWLRHGRAWILGLLAVALAWHAQSIVREQGEDGVPASTSWYALAILTLILGITGTYLRRSMLPVEPAPSASPPQSRQPAVGDSGSAALEEPPGSREEQAVPSRSPRGEPGSTSLLENARLLLRGRRPRVAGPAVRWLLTALALLLGFAGMQTLRGNWSSAAGSWAFIAGLALLILAWTGQGVERLPAESELPAASSDAELATDWRPDRRREALYVGLVMLTALGLRLYGLGNLAWGMHGDEGKASEDALAILQGNAVSPFTAGWFNQPNVYYWSVAIGMKLFGVDLAGLRISAVVFSMLALPFFYLLIREMLGVRAAYIGLGLLAANSLFLHYSRVQFSNITTPVFWIIGFYFLFRALRTRRMVDFALAAYASFFSLYFYNGARILPFMLAGLFVYMAIFQRHFVRRYWSGLVVFFIAAYLISAPFVGYYLDHAAQMNERSQEKLIYNNPEIMRGMYGEPFLVRLLPGIEFTPTPEVYYFWRQLTMTGSMFTFRPTASSIYYFTGEPIVNSLESVLLILGIAMAFWRWRDPRYALLLIWFWAPFIAGGVLTIEAPYTDRLVGLFPVLMIFVALVANKLAAEFVAFCRGWPSPPARLAGAPLAALALISLVAGLGFFDATSYFGRYVKNHWMGPDTSQAYFLQHTGPSYKYYVIGVPYLLGWEHGASNFVRITRNIEGRDTLNLGEEVPYQDTEERDVLFIVRNGMESHLATLQAYYPGGRAEPYFFDDEINTFSSYKLPASAVAARQQVEVRYTPAGGEPLITQAPGIGTAVSPPPEGAAYPVAASWSGGLVAPAYGTYFFRLAAPAGSTLSIDGRVVLTAAGNTAEGEVIMADGLHSFSLQAALAAPGEEVALSWRREGGQWATPERAQLWNGPPGTLLCEIYPLREEAISGGLEVDLDRPAEVEGGPPRGERALPLVRRTEPILDWRRPERVLGHGGPYTARWRGKFIAPDSGSYAFEVSSDGDSGVWIDGRPVVTHVHHGEISNASGEVDLSAGMHDVEIRYNWHGGHALMVLYVTPPGGRRVVANGLMFAPAGGVWLPGEIPAPATP